MYKLKEIYVNKSIALLTLLLAGLSSVTALAADRAIETVYRLDAETPPANLAIAPNGRMFMSIHPFYGRNDKVVEIHKDGSVSPYPNKAETPEAVKARLELNGVLGLRVDRRGILWLLDAAGDGHSGKIVGWDTVNESLHPDGFSIGPDDQVYLTVNELHRSAVLNSGKDTTKGKFKIMRFAPLAPSETGR
jgi:hypothetical protein